MRSIRTRFAALILAFVCGCKNFFQFHAANVAKIALAGVVIIEGYFLRFFPAGKEIGE